MIHNKIISIFLVMTRGRGGQFYLSVWSLSWVLKDGSKWTRRELDIPSKTRKCTKVPRVAVSLALPVLSRESLLYSFEDSRLGVHQPVVSPDSPVGMWSFIKGHGYPLKTEKRSINVQKKLSDNGFISACWLLASCLVSFSPTTQSSGWNSISRLYRGLR